MSRRARERANARPWEAGEDPDSQLAGDWSDGCGEGDDDEQDDDRDD
jgi:hypothetical protein